MKFTISHKCNILIFDNYIRHQYLKNELLHTLENYSDIQNKNTNVKATMTEWNITSSEIEILKNFIMEKSYPFRWSNYNFIIKDFWANIYRKNDYAEIHDHLPSVISFVYFLKSKNNFCPLTFNTFWRNKKIKPKEGRLVIFPSYVRHSVPMHKHEDVRITLSGNINTI